MVQPAVIATFWIPVAEPVRAQEFLERLSGSSKQRPLYSGDIDPTAPGAVTVITPAPDCEGIDASTIEQQP